MDIRRSQDAIVDSLDTLQHQILEKVSTVEVDMRIEGKYEEIIDHLQKALRATESDEDDFKKCADELKTSVEGLRKSKADKKDMSDLKTLIMTQLGAGCKCNLYFMYTIDQFLSTHMQFALIVHVWICQKYSPFMTLL